MCAAYPVDGTFDFAVAARHTCFAVGIVFAVYLHHVAVVVFLAACAFHDVSAFQTHFLSRSHTEIFLRGVFHEVVAFYPQFAAEFDGVCACRRIFRVVDSFHFLHLSFGIVGNDQFHRIDDCRYTGSLMRMTATNSDAQLAADIANAAADAVAERISEVMVIDKPSSVEEAEKPNYPVSPNVKKNMIMGGLIGAVLAVGVFTLLFLLDDTIKSEEDVRRYLQLNTLASIPKEKKRRRASSEA